jgi:hypothetical protein
LITLDLVGRLHGKHVVATWKRKTGTIPAFALGPRKTKKNRCRDGSYLCFRDEKQIDFAEQVESVAYVLCGEDAVTLEKFCQIFQAKGVSKASNLQFY